MMLPGLDVTPAPETSDPVRLIPDDPEADLR